MLERIEEKFNAMLALEFSNRAYFSVHHISVPTFMLQTGRYAKPYREKARNMLEAFLAQPDELPRATTIKDINMEFSSAKRTDNIFNKKTGDILNSDFTIFDVRIDTPEHYRKDVVAWARAVVTECNKEAER